jgi:hypothetical protein
MHIRRAGRAPTKGPGQNGVLCISAAALRLPVRVVGKLCPGCGQLAVHGLCATYPHPGAGHPRARLINVSVNSILSWRFKISSKLARNL